jgi:hypothetical protein
VYKITVKDPEWIGYLTHLRKYGNEIKKDVYIRGNRVCFGLR